MVSPQFIRISTSLFILNCLFAWVFCEKLKFNSQGVKITQVDLPPLTRNNRLQSQYSFSFSIPEDAKEMKTEIAIQRELKQTKKVDVVKLSTNYPLKLDYVSGDVVIIAFQNPMVPVVVTIDYQYAAPAPVYKHLEKVTALNENSEVATSAKRLKLFGKEIYP